MAPPPGAYPPAAYGAGTGYGPPPGFGPPGQPGIPSQPWQPGAPPVSQQKNNMATAAVIFGTIGLLLFWACFAGAAVSIVAIVLGVIGRTRSKELPEELGKGAATAGIALGAIGLIAGIVVPLLFVLGTETGGVNSDPSDGFCNEDRWVQDPDC